MPGLTRQFSSVYTLSAPNTQKNVGPRHPLALGYAMSTEGMGSSWIVPTHIGGGSRIDSGCPGEDQA